MKVLPLSPQWQVEFPGGTKWCNLERFPKTNIFENVALRSQRIISWAAEPSGTLLTQADVPEEKAPSHTLLLKGRTDISQGPNSGLGGGHHQPTLRISRKTCSIFPVS